MKSASFFIVLLLCGAVIAQDEPHKQHAKAARQHEIAGEYEKALAEYQTALELGRSINAKQAAAIAYFKGSLHLQLQQYAEAEAALKESVELREKEFGKDHGAVAVSLIGLAGVYYALGDYAQSKPLYERAVQINEAAHGSDNPRITVSLNSLAEQYRTLAAFDDAEPLFQRALKIDRDAFGENHPKVAIRLNNLAELYRQKGDYAQAKELLEHALKIEQAAFDQQETAKENLGIRHNNLGRLYQTLGDYPTAEEHYQKALDIWADTPGKSHIMYAIGLNNKGWIAYVTGNYPRAQKLYNDASSIVEKVHGDNHPELARHLNNLGLLYLAQQKYEAAEKAWLRGLQILETVYDSQHPEIGTILHNLAKLYRARQEYPKAEDNLQKALLIAQGSDQPELIWSIHDNFSQLLLAQQNPTAAIIYGKQAVNTLQGLRANIAAMDKQLQRAFLEDKTDVYRRLASLLMDQGRLAEAQQVLVMLKEEEYFDFIRRDAGSDIRAVKAGFNVSEQPWIKRYDSLIQRINQIGEALASMRQKTRLNTLEARRQKQLEKEAEEALAQVQQYFSELKTAFDQEQDWADKKTDICLAELKVEQAVRDQNQDTLKALQTSLRKLGNGAVILHYLATRDKLRIILTTPDKQICRDSKIGERALIQKIAAFRLLLLNAGRYPVNEATELFDFVLGPVKEDLESFDAKTLMLSLDGELRYLPFSTLFDSEKKRFLSQLYALAVFTEAARDKIDEAPQNEAWQLAGLGVSEQHRGMNPLPSVPKELNGIIKEGEGDDNGILPGIVKLNSEFTAQSLLDTLQEKTYPAIHLASHFIFKAAGTDQDSFLLLGDGNGLTLANIRESYDFQGVDMLTLSACETGMGSVGADGREVEGFGVLAQKKGAKSVIATLWPVTDESTGLFMQSLYQIYTENPDITKAEAMRQAQEALLKNRRFSHPHYWAPFILLGNWL